MCGERSSKHALSVFVKISLFGDRRDVETELRVFMMLHIDWIQLRWNNNQTYVDICMIVEDKIRVLKT